MQVAELPGRRMKMKSKYLRINVGGAFLAFSLLLGVGITSASTAQAQWRNDRSYQDQDRRDRDYNRDDQRRDRDYNRNDQGRDRDDRYDRNRGSRNNDGYPNFGGSFQLRQTALNAGYNNGIQAGRRDRDRRDRRDFRNESSFQKATQDYSSRLGDRELYRRYFRLAFPRGY